MVKISVIIPCRNEKKYIIDFLESVFKNDYPKELLEVFIIDGKSVDGTTEILQRFIKDFPIFTLLTNEKKTVPYALNQAIKKCTGDYIIRLDVHSKIPENYFSKLIKSAIEMGADNIGTICITEVKNKNPKSHAIKKVLSNKIGVGNSYFRIGTKTAIEVDNVPFGCYKKNVFKKYGLFNNQLVRNQDIELNKRIIKGGGKIILLPEPYSIYYARETFNDLAKNNFATGLWNILTIYITKNFNSVSLRHFIPLIFLLSLLVPLIMTILNEYFGLISLLSLISYFILIITVSLKNKDNTTTLYNLIVSFIVLHFSYGFGSLSGLFRLYLLFKKNEIEYL
ncbi:MAG: glycosyltransferase family 2 protein [Ignavibacterium sp.]|jgi:glycosyltransferase involved in cell wall biosynthesis|nr:glycosyltransferase family 2 protein [Ignavibacterium sp.]